MLTFGYLGVFGYPWLPLITFPYLWLPSVTLLVITGPYWALLGPTGPYFAFVHGLTNIVHYDLLGCSRSQKRGWADTAVCIQSIRYIYIYYVLCRQFSKL